MSMRALRLVVLATIWIASLPAGATGDAGAGGRPAPDNPVELTLEVGQAHLIEVPGVRNLCTFALED